MFSEGYRALLTSAFHIPFTSAPAAPWTHLYNPTRPQVSCCGTSIDGSRGRTGREISGSTGPCTTETRLPYGLRSEALIYSSWLSVMFLFCCLLPYFNGKGFCLMSLISIAPMRFSTCSNRTVKQKKGHPAPGRLFVLQMSV